MSPSQDECLEAILEAYCQLADCLARISRETEAARALLNDVTNNLGAELAEAAGVEEAARPPSGLPRTGFTRVRRLKSPVVVLFGFSWAEGFSAANENQANSPPTSTI
jgi:hypothetical protein